MLQCGECADFVKPLPQLSRSRARDMKKAIILSAGRSNFPLAVSTHLSQATGGRAEVIGASTALPDKLNALAESLVVNDQQLASWYEVEYASTSKEARPLVAVSISRPETRAELSMVRRLP